MCLAHLSPVLSRLWVCYVRCADCVKRGSASLADRLGCVYLYTKTELRSLDNPALSVKGKKSLCVRTQKMNI